MASPLAGSAHFFQEVFPGGDVEKWPTVNSCAAKRREHGMKRGPDVCFVLLFTASKDSIVVGY